VTALTYALAAISLGVHLITIGVVMLIARRLPRHQSTWFFLALLPFILFCQGLMELLTGDPASTHAIEFASWSFLAGLLLTLGVLSLRRVFLDLIESARQIEELARRDGLTRFLRREAWALQVERTLRECQNNSDHMVLLELDIDHFKAVNDEFGHEIGDEVIHALADLCSRTLRQSDIWGRLGGEEFVCALPKTTRAEGTEIAERLRQTIAHHFFSTGQGGIHITVSIGLTSVEPDAPKRSDDRTYLRELIKEADDAMYRAKSSGRNCCAHHNAAVSLPRG